MHQPQQVFTAKGEGQEGLERMEVLIRLKSIVLKSSTPENNEIGLPNSPSLTLDHIFDKINLYLGILTVSKLTQTHTALLLRSSLTVFCSS